MSSRRQFLYALSTAPLVLMWSPSFAQETGPAGGEGAVESEAEAVRSVELPGLVFPVFDEKFKLRNYLLVSARMLVGPGKDVWKYREQQHFIRDAILSASHRVSFNARGNYRKLDEKLAAAECLKAANQVIGEKDALIKMTFTKVASQG